MDNPTDSLPYLPPEMYEEIFSNVSGEDFLSVINANPDWDDLLWNQKNAVLFPLVLNILTKDQRYLKRKDLLPCRLVHSNWKSAVDSTMARDPHNYFQFEYEFNGGSEAFVNHTHLLRSGNPFLGKYLRCNFFDLQLHTVLERFGSHLETLTLNFTDWAAVITPDDVLRRLSSFLTLTPNVRDLTPDICINYPEAPPIQPLRELPPLPQLNKLDISGCALWFHSIRSDDYVPILETLIVEAYGATLSELICAPYLFLIEGVQDLFPNLRKLSVTNDDGLSNQALGILAGFQSRMLETLNIELADGVNFSPEIVNVLANFPALKSVTMNPMPRFTDELGAISGIQELTMESDRESFEKVLEDIVAIVHVMSHTFPDLEILTIISDVDSLETKRENQQALFDGMKKLKYIHLMIYGDELSFTR